MTQMPDIAQSMSFRPNKFLTRRGMLATAAAFTWAHALPVGADTAAPSPQQLLTREGRYLPWLRDLTARFRAKGTTNVGSGQLLSYLLAATGDEAGAFAVWHEATGAGPLRQQPQESELEARLAAAQSQRAVSAIASASRSHRIVILNEAHHASICRSFAAQVAARLRYEGFSWFAAETFNSVPTYKFAHRMNADEPITSSTGMFTIDPVFAELVRVCRRVGYRLADYEIRPDQRPPADSSVATQTEAREEAQSENLIRNILDRDPDARVLVFCGYNHASEALGGDLVSMAARLKQKTGLDPLTINQARYIAPPRRASEHPWHGTVLDHFRPATSIVLRDKSGRPVLPPEAQEGQFDLYVYHPRHRARGTRPGWLYEGPGRRPVSYHLPLPIAERAVVRAIPHREAFAAVDAVPADQFWIEPGARSATFVLTAGVYVVRLETESGVQELGQLELK